MPEIDLFQTIVKTYGYDIVGINESWLDMNGRNFYGEIGIRWFRNFSVAMSFPSKSGGGSVFYAKTILRPSQGNSNNNNLWDSPGRYNALWRDNTVSSISVPNPRIIVAEDVLIDELNNIFFSSHDSILMEDFNLPDINWISLEAKLQGVRLIRHFNDNNQDQYVEEPTRRPSILDLVFSAEEQLELVTVIDIIGDHHTVKFQITVIRKKLDWAIGITIISEEPMLTAWKTTL